MGGAPLWRALVAVQVAGVCWLAFDPQPPAAATTSLDKLDHALAFAVMAFSARLGWPRARALAPALALLALGALIEIVQLGVPGRSSELADLAADGVGITIGLALQRATRR